MFTDWNNTGTAVYDMPGFGQAMQKATIGENGAWSAQQMMTDAAAQAYSSGDPVTAQGETRPGTQTPGQLAENASNYLTKRGVGTKESSGSNGEPALTTMFGNGQAGLMIFRQTDIGIIVNDTRGIEVTEMYTLVR